MSFLLLMFCIGGIAEQTSSCVGITSLSVNVFCNILCPVIVLLAKVSHYSYEEYVATPAQGHQQKASQMLHMQLQMHRWGLACVYNKSARRPITPNILTAISNLSLTRLCCSHSCST